MRESILTIPSTISRPLPTISIPWSVGGPDSMTNGYSISNETSLYNLSSQPMVARTGGVCAFDHYSFLVLEQGLIIIRDQLSDKWSIESLNTGETVWATSSLSDPNSLHIVNLRWLKDSLSLGMSGLAELLGVTRKTVYDWFDGVEPRRDGRFAKVAALRTALEKTISADERATIKRIWNLPLADGGTLRSILGAGEEDAVQLEAKISRSWRELKGNTIAVAQRNSSSSHTNFGLAQTEDLVRGS
jgi:DNA-binding transcriptional regulator YiaG